MKAEENTLLIEINATLEQIQRANQIIAYHEAFKELDTSAIDNFRSLRKDFLAQLTDLFKELNLEVRLKEAA